MDIKDLQDTPPWEWPADTDRLLLRILTNPGAAAEERRVAAELAGDYSVVNDDLVRALLEVVEDEGEPLELRSTAVIALGPALEQADMMEFDEEDDILISEPLFEEILERLHQLYVRPELPQELRRRVLEAAVRSPQAWHHEAVQSAYAHFEPAWRQTALFCMGYIGGFDKEILESLQSEDPIVHYHAVCAAGNWEIEEAYAHIAGLVRSEETEKDLRIAAIGAAATIRPEEASMLLTNLIDAQDEDIVEAVLEALAMADGLEGFDAASFDDEPEA